MSHPVIETEEEVLDRLSSRYPMPDKDSPTLVTGQIALERRTSSRRASPLGRRASPLNRLPHINSPVFTSDYGTRVSSPSPRAIDHRLRTVPSSPGPSKTEAFVRRAPPPLQLVPKRTRPASELFLLTPVDPKQRMTIFQLPKIVDETSSPSSGDRCLPNELFLAMPSNSERNSSVLEEELDVGRDDEESFDLEPASPEAPPLSPISNALSKARYSRLDVHSSVRHAINNVNIITEHPALHHQRSKLAPIGIERSATAPPPEQNRLSTATVKSTRSMPVRISSIRAVGASSRGAGVRPVATMSIWKQRGTRFPGIDKDFTAVKRASALSARYKQEIGPSEAAAAAVEAPSSPEISYQKSKTSASVLPWRRKRRGETMSMLLDSGFFPVNEFIYNPKKQEDPKSAISPTKKGRLALSIFTDHTPTRPSSISRTPSEFYQNTSLASPRRHIRGSTRRRSGAPRKRVIGQLNSAPKSPRSSIIAAALALSPLSSLASPSTPSTPSSAFTTLSGKSSVVHSPHDKSPGLLEVIPEDGDAMNRSTLPPVILEESDIITEEPMDVPADMPIRTEIHLISGTVLTVTPPELTCWTKSVYIPGPIRLVASLMAPRKDSIASLAPFQDAVDNIYDQALPVPRRASEDQTVDDILKWYEEWNFEYPSFAFDDFKENLTPSPDRESSIYDIDDSPGPMEKAITAHMLSDAKHPLPKSLSVLGITASDLENPFLPTSPTKSIFSFPFRSNVSSRKNSTGNYTAGPRKGSGHALGTLPEGRILENESSHYSTINAVSPLAPGILGRQGIETDADQVTKATLNRPPIDPKCNQNTNASKLSLEWGDDDTPEEPSGIPSWLLPGGHLEVKEIRGRRNSSCGTVESGVGVGVVVNTLKDEDRNVSVQAQVGDKKKKKTGGMTGVRRFVAGTGGIL